MHYDAEMYLLGHPSRWGWVGVNLREIYSLSFLLIHRIYFFNLLLIFVVSVRVSLVALAVLEFIR